MDGVAVLEALVCVGLPADSPLWSLDVNDERIDSDDEQKREMTTSPFLTPPALPRSLNDGFLSAGRGGGAPPEWASQRAHISIAHISERALGCVFGASAQGCSPLPELAPPNMAAQSAHTLGCGFASRLALE